MFVLGRSFFLAILFPVLLFSKTINSFYGPIEVGEPVLLDLIESPAMQRLKLVHQYGVAYYTTHPEEYNRFDHSIGVFAFLRLKGASLEEQISGLLHDVSHTVFSHVGDWIFGKEHQEDDYQTTIHTLNMAVSGVEEILNKHGFTVDEVLPKTNGFAMLEQSLPNLSADRLDYNIQGAYFQNFLTKQEAIELFQDFYYENGRWITTRIDLATKLAQFSLYMTESCWGSALNYVTSRFLADAILKGLEIGLLSWKELHFGIDQIVWEKLQVSSDPFIQKRMEMVSNPAGYYQLVSPPDASILVKFRCRGIDPWVTHEEKIVRLTSIDPDLGQKFQVVKEHAASGWPIKFSFFLGCKA